MGRIVGERLNKTFETAVTVADVGVSFAAVELVADTDIDVHGIDAYVQVFTFTNAGNHSYFALAIYRNGNLDQDIALSAQAQLAQAELLWKVTAGSNQFNKTVDFSKPYRLPAGHKYIIVAFNLVNGPTGAEPNVLFGITVRGERVDDVAPRESPVRIE